jgi:hypothetical protein
MARSRKRKLETNIPVVDAAILGTGDARDSKQPGTTVREWLDTLRSGTRENESSHVLAADNAGAPSA